MSQDENTSVDLENQNAIPAEVAEPVEQLTGSKAIVSVYQEVAAIAKDAPVLRQKLVKLLSEAEQDAKVATLVKAYNKRKDLMKELEKIKPEISFDGEGKALPPVYTKAAFEQRKKAQESLNKFDKAFTKALEKADFGELNNLCK